MHDFIMSYIDHLENIGSLSYTDLSNVDASYYQIQEHHIHNNTNNLIRKVFEYWVAIKLIV